MKLALIYGGCGCESDVSVKGFEFVYPILRHKYDCLPVFIDKNGRWLVGDKRVFPIDGGFYFIDSHAFVKVDSAFPLLHGDFGEDGIVQGTLDTAHIPYVGCDGRVGAICRDKSVVKAVAEDLGIPILPYVTLFRGDEIPNLDYPVFVKPASLGSSIGASLANNEQELKSSLEVAFGLCNKIIIERLLIPKRELECGYFACKCKELFTDVGEILTDGFYDYDKKYGDFGAQAIPCAVVDTEINSKIKDYARRLVHRLGVRQICRVDFFLSGEDIYFNEINTMPGFTETSLYHMMLSEEGIDICDLLTELVGGAV